MSGMLQSASSIVSRARALFRRAGRVPARTPMLEALENRSLMSGTPLPTIGDLNNPSHTVIRMETNFGDIDIEMFDDLAPNTVNNFLSYITNGRIDRSFFHRMVDADDNPNTPTVDEEFRILQGGGYYFDNVNTWSEVPDDPAINLEHDVGNVERTIAMARTSQINSATSQFFFNMTDNSDQLDRRDPGAEFPQGRNGYAVFGRVIQGWNVVQAIQALTVQDLSSDTSFTGSGTLFEEVPVTAQHNPNAGVREASLVFLTNAEVIKPNGANSFYTQKLVYPEGNHTGGAREFIDLANPNGAPASYQIIARYETGRRDTILQSGTIAANTTLRLALADTTGTPMVRNDSPYALEVHTSLPTSVTTPLPIAVSSVRRDFNADASESFLNITNLSNTTLRTWDIARFERNALSREFLVWQSLSSTDATVTVTFTRQGGSPTTITRSLQAYRRGGLELFNIGLADGTYSARITSTVELAVALSDFDIAASGQDAATASTPGWAVLGTNGGGATTGVLANAEMKTGFTNVISIANPNSATAVITFSFRRSNGDPAIQRVAIVTSNSRLDYSLDPTVLGIPVDERFSVTYTSGSANVTLQYTSVDETNRNLSGGARSDGVSTNFDIQTAEQAAFTNGYNDPTRTDATQSEILSLFNPFANSGITYNYTVVAKFSDGSEVSIASGALTANQRADLAIDQNGALRLKAASDPQFQHYTLLVRGTATQGSNTRSVAPFAQLVRRDTTRVEAETVRPILMGVLTAYNNAIFTPGGTI